MMIYLYYILYYYILLSFIHYYFYILLFMKYVYVYIVYHYIIQLFSKNLTLSYGCDHNAVWKAYIMTLNEY